jgi:hypothetical protein
VRGREKKADEMQSDPSGVRVPMYDIWVRCWAGKFIKAKREEREGTTRRDQGKVP